MYCPDGPGREVWAGSPIRDDHRAFPNQTAGRMIQKPNDEKDERQERTNENEDDGRG
jgi:hypothetical protein